MDKVNINNQNQNQNQSTIQTDKNASSNIFEEIDSLLSGLESIREENINKNAEPNKNSATIINENKTIEEEVVFKPNNDIVDKGNKYIESLEQDRMVKIKQKQILMKLGQDRIQAALEGKSHSRNMDEAAILNRNKKDANEANKEDNINIKRVMKEENIEDILDVSEELDEEFFKKDHKKFFKNDENIENKKSLEEEKSNKGKKEDQKKSFKQKDYEIEEDELMMINTKEDDNSFIKNFHNVTEIEKIFNIGEEIKREVIKTSNERYMYNYLGTQFQQKARLSKMNDARGRKLDINSKTKNIRKLRNKFNHLKEEDLIKSLQKEQILNKVQSFDYIQDKIIEFAENMFFKVKAILLNIKMKASDENKKKNQLDELKKKINELQRELNMKEKERIIEIKESKESIKKIKKLISKVDI